MLADVDLTQRVLELLEKDKYKNPTYEPTAFIKLFCSFWKKGFWNYRGLLTDFLIKT